MYSPSPELWNRLSEAFASGTKSEGLLLVMQLFPGRHGQDLVTACTEAGDLARLNYDLYNAEGFYRLAITLYDRYFVEAHKEGISSVKHLIHVLEAQACNDEAWHVVRQTEDLCVRASAALSNQICNLQRNLSA